MATFNYVMGQTNSFRNAAIGIHIPAMWTATCIDGLPNGKTLNSGAHMTAKEAALALSKAMREAGYTGTLKLVPDVTVKTDKPIAKLKKMIKRRKAMAMEVVKSEVKVAKPAKVSDTVTFDAWLDTSRETVKAYKLHNSAYVGKSICHFQPSGKAKYVTDKAHGGKISILYGSLTMPTWLYAKIG
jgi:hypothetical protein